MNEPEPATGQSGGENHATLELIGDFVVSLIQAFLRTGYYLSEHPESKRAKAGLYEKFAQLARGSGEISFLLKEEHGLKSITIEGVQKESIRLVDIMTKGMSETYNPRFAQYLERKELISLSLSSRMGEEEFSGFIDVMSEPSLSDMRGVGAKDTFVASLKEMGVCHLSFVFREDFVSLRPGIPWRVGMALSRLKKDIRMVPIFRKMSDAELQHVRKEIFHDILRPIHNSDLVYAFLINIDLASTAEMPENESEDTLLESLRRELIPPMSTRFVHDVVGKRQLFSAYVSREKVARLVKKIASRLKPDYSPEARAALEEMCHSGLLPMDELPADVREQVRAARHAARFLESRDHNLALFDAVHDLREYVSRVKGMLAIVRYLLEKGSCLDAIPLVETVAAHGREDSKRGAVARSALAWLGERAPLEPVAEAFLRGSKSERLALGRILLMAGQRSEPHLLHIIRATGDLWCSKLAAEYLVQFGPEAALSLVRELEEGKLTADATAAIIRVLQDAEDTAVTEAFLRVIRRKVDDPGPEIRREALNALARLAPRESFALFRGLLDDDDVKVRKTALRGLGQSGDPRAFEPVAWCLEKSVKGEKGEARELSAAAIDALGVLSKNSPQARDSIVRLLTMLAKQITTGGTWQKLLGRSLSLPPEAILALGENLLAIDSAEAKKVAGILADHQDRNIAAKAREFLKRMEKG